MEIANTLVGDNSTRSSVTIYGSAILFPYYYPAYKEMPGSLELDTDNASDTDLVRDNKNYLDASWELPSWVNAGLKFNYQDIVGCGLGWSSQAMAEMEALYDVPLTLRWDAQPVNVVYIDKATGTIIEEGQFGGTYEIGTDIEVEVKTKIDGYRRVFMYYGSTAGYIESGNYVYPYSSLDEAKSHANTMVALDDKDSEYFDDVVVYNNGGTTVVCVMEEGGAEVHQFWVDEDGNELKENEELGPYSTGDTAKAEYEEVLMVDDQRYELISSHIRTLTVDGEENPARYQRTVEDDGLDATRLRDREMDKFGFNFYGVYRPAEAPPGTVTVTYITENGDLIKQEEIGQFPIGSTVTGDVDFTVEDTLEYKGSDYNLQSSYTIKHTDPAEEGEVKDLASSTLEEVKGRSEEVIEEGIEFVYVMRIDGVPVITPIPSVTPPPGQSVPQRPNVTARPNVSMGIVDPDAEGVVHSMDRDNEEFDVETTGTPTDEYTYVNVITDAFLMEYEFADNVDATPTIVTVVQPYTWTKQTNNPIWRDPVIDPDTGATLVPGGWEDDYTYSQESGQEEIDITVYRKYSYYTVEKFGLYELDHSDVDQYCLPGETIELRPHGYTSPTYTYSAGGIVSAPPDTITYTLASIDLGTHQSDPGYSIPQSSAQSAAEAQVPEYQVQNDTLTVNGDTYLDGSVVEEKTDPPTPAITNQSQIGKIDRNVLYEVDNYIDKDKKNGWYDSEGTVTYTCVGTVGSSSSADRVYDARVNRVLIHSPVVCYPEITEDNKEWTQLVTPPTDPDVALLVLDKEFTIKFTPEGEHKTGKGYGDRDYSQYTEKRQVRFEFDVYDGNTFVPADTWYDLAGDDARGYETEFYIPIWVEEGAHNIEFRSIANNADANDPNYEHDEFEANKDYNNYVAYNEITCYVSGRLYGLEITDISDYPEWEDVFRPGPGSDLTGKTYPVGKADEDGNDNGLDCLDTLPLVNGSHPVYKNVGITGTGYFIRFRLSTLGSMDYDTSLISITPSFFWISEDGTTREEVDVYYSETIDGRKRNLVKVGDTLDGMNYHRIEVGSPMLGIPESDLATTARIRGMDLDDFKAQNHEIYTFSDITIDSSLRVFVGQSTRTDAPADEIKKSMQDWYCEYYLPSEIHVAPKGQALPATVDYRESFWKTDGYLLVQFDIVSYTQNTSAANLSYINADNVAGGFLNQWNKEDPCYTKTDWKGNRFSFVDGDFVLFKIGDSAGDDWESEGTH